jgi:hypothetical protein
MESGFTPLFTGGSGRSGTTILINLLNKHPQVHASLPREIKYLTSRFGLVDLNFGRPFRYEEDIRGVRNNIAANIFNLLGKRKLDHFLTYLNNTWWSEIGKKDKARGLVQGISKAQLSTAIENFEKYYSVDKMRASRAFFYEISNAQISKPAIKYFADSTPVNLMQSDLIYKIFPSAKFINIIRDGRDVALSVSREKWGPNDPYQALDWWANRILVAHKSLKQVRESDQINLRLEDLIINNRSHEYAKILNFLKIEDFSDMRNYFDLQMSPGNMSQAEWKKQVKNPDKFNKKYDKILLKLKSKGIEINKFY